MLNETDMCRANCNSKWDGISALIDVNTVCYGSTAKLEVDFD